ncbi:hypothetical protein ABIE21_002971 [Conyzicola nivalis]|uniref:DUF1206 domain-containing protein n=1 Tax=Conyzicola nivalis TaxID=1477021 RepID=A0ABV2QQZ0_9MICO
MNTTAGQATESVRSGAQSLHENHVFRMFARVGYAVNGVIHILIGGIALSVAFGDGGDADQGGALAQVAEAPLGFALLWFLAGGLFALGLFQVLETVLVRGTDKDDWADRAKEGGKAIAYLAVGGSAATYALGGSPDSGDQAQSLSAQLLTSPGGVVLLVVLGLGVAAVGAYFVTKGIRQKFLDDLALTNGSRKKTATVLGVLGYVSKGVAIAIVGVLFVVAAVTSDTSEATGLDGALKTLAELPFGNVLLVVVAFGLAAYGVYCFIRARYPRS